MIIEIIRALTCAILSYIYYYIRVKSYWRKRGVYSFKGLAGPFTKKLIFNGDWSLFELIIDLYNKVKERGQNYGGFCDISAQTLMVTDPDIYKRILIKDSNYFDSRGTYYNRKAEPLQAFLFDLEGAEWRHMRQKLSYTFTSGKMKMMFGTLIDCSLNLHAVLNEYARNKKAVPIKDVLSRLTIDVIVNVAFGLKCNSLENLDEEFRYLGKNYFKRTFWIPFLILIVPLLPPSLVALLKLKVGNPSMQNKFLNIIKNNAEYREKNKIVRNDFFQLLLQLKNTEKVLNGKTHVEEKLTIEEVAGQCAFFFLAGFDTSSSAMAFTLYELSLNQDIQNKLRESINKVLDKHDGKISYEAIYEMSYLHMVLYETMRKYPVISMLSRKCTKSYTIPKTKLTIEKGVKIWIPISGLHRDPDYWPEPDTYDPERFNPERLSKDNQNIRKNKLVYLPFGEGSRMCLGLRLGLLQSKLGLVTIIKNFKVTFNKDTVCPITFQPRSIVSSPEHDIFLNFSTI